MTNLVEVSGLNIRFTGERTVHAVNDLSFSLGEGEVLGLLGESGSGKSVTLRALMRLLPRKRTQISGSVRFSAATCWRSTRKNCRRSAARPSR